jgi:hypothetical protein
MKRGDKVTVNLPGWDAGREYTLKAVIENHACDLEADDGRRVCNIPIKAVKPSRGKSA